MKFDSYLNESSDVWKYFSKKTDMPFYDGIYSKPEYHRRAKKLEAEIVMLTPAKYYQECGKLHKQTAFSQENIVDLQHVDNIIKSIKETGSKMNLPMLDYAYETQEGRHRAKIAQKLGLKEIPVLVVKRVEE
ncbi:MAG: ParB N-terminal domain-containing protein [Candidatus Shapirobacteria bacterium]